MNTDYNYINKSLEKAVIDLKPSFFDIIILGQRLEDALTKLIEEENDLNTKQYLMDFSSRVSKTLKNTFQSVQELTANAKELDSHTKELSLFDANVVQNIFKSIKDAEKNDEIQNIKTNEIENIKQDELENVNSVKNQTNFSKQLEENSELKNQENLLDKINSIYEQEAQKTFDISPNSDIKAFEPITPIEENSVPPLEKTRELNEMDNKILTPERIEKEQSENEQKENLESNSNLTSIEQDNSSFLQQEGPIDYTKNTSENDGMDLPYPIESDNIENNPIESDQTPNYDGFVGEYSDNNYFNNSNNIDNNSQYSYNQPYHQELENNNETGGQELNWNNAESETNVYSDSMPFQTQSSYQENYNENIAPMNNETGGQELNWNNENSNTNQYSNVVPFPGQNSYEENYSENIAPMNNETDGQELNWNNEMSETNQYSDEMSFPTQNSYEENYSENITPMSNETDDQQLNWNNQTLETQYAYDNDNYSAQNSYIDENNTNIENNISNEQDVEQKIDTTPEEIAAEDNNIGKVESILKSSKEEGKAIIVTDSQYNNLAASLDSQEKLLYGKTITQEVLNNTKKVLDNLLKKEINIPSNGETYYVEAENNIQDEPNVNYNYSMDNNQNITPQIYEEPENTTELHSMVQQAVDSNYSADSQPISKQPIVPESIEKMLENAKELYDAGYTKEANDLYEKISNMNQSQKEMQYVKTA